MSETRPVAVILAAGKGTRLKSHTAKVLQRAAGLPLLEHVLRAVAPLQPRATLVVVGHQAEAVELAFAGRGLSFVRQEPQLGTGHALLVARAALPAHGTVLVLSGDVPLLRPRTLAQLLEAHLADGADATLLTAVLDEPGAYGRVLRGADGRPQAVVEARDATPEQRACREINVGLYAFEAAALLRALDGLRPENAQGEYYLTDVVAALSADGARLLGAAADDAGEVLGVNTQAELAESARWLRRRRVEELMAAGVVVEDPETTHVGADVAVEADAVLRPFTLLEGRTRVARGAVVGPFARLENVDVGSGAQVLDHCLLRDCCVGPGAAVGPFTHVRPETRIGARAKVGNFVELKKTDLGEGSKAPHLSYLGDATIGSGVNIGAGTITCNYDGTAKYPTRIEDGAFVGSDSTLVAPVTIGAGAYVGAGSTITKDVPAEALAVGRARQVVKEGWARTRRARSGGPRH